MAISSKAGACRLAPRIAVAALVASASLSFGATTLTWTGTTSGNWSDATNWGGVGVPDNSGDTLIFPSVSGTRTMNNDITGVVVNAITVNSGLYSLSGNGITFDGTNPIYTNNAGGSGDAITNNETITLNTTTTFVSTGATRLTLSGDITGTGGLTIGTSTGAGTVRLSGVVKTYTGDTNINFGTLDLVTTASLLPSGAGKGNVNIAAGATLLDENVNVDINGLNGAGTINRNTGSNTRGLTVGNNNANGTFTGTITNAGSGAYSVTKNGTGTQTLGTISINAGVNANNGTLVLNGPVSAATITVATAGTLAGTGTFTLTGAFTANGIVAPGNLGVGAMNDSSASATFSATSSLAIQIGGNSAGTGYDQLNFTNAAGTVTLDPASTLSLSLVSGYTPSNSDVDYILTRADGGTFANGFAGLAEGATVTVGAYTAQITYAANWTGTQAGSSLTGGNDVALYNFQPAAVPEPASLGVLALGAVGLLARRRK
jgi:autotransporter-associated beta strand protein